MEDKETFVEETNYKELFDCKYAQCKRLEETNSALTDKVEDLERELAEARREAADVRGHVDVLEGRIDNLMGQVDAYKYAIRYHMAGDPA